MLRTKSVLLVIPAFNRPDQLERAVRSVFDQTNSSYSLVVVDDASPRDLSSCRDLVTGRGHQWIVQDRNAGPAAARNLGAGMAKSDWIVFLDSDDVWLPEKLERQIAWHSANPAIRISQVREKWIRNGVVFPKPAHLEQPEGSIFPECVARCAVSPSCVAIRRDLWEETGGFDPWFRVCEDYELWLRIALREKVGLVDGDALVEKHGGHSDQLSTAVPALDGYRFVALALLLNREPSLPEKYRDLVIAAFVKKAGILAQGAARRSRGDWEAFFREVKVPLSEIDIEKAKKFCSGIDGAP